jgi:hypothetical protein
LEFQDGRGEINISVIGLQIGNARLAVDGELISESNLAGSNWLAVVNKMNGRSISNLVTEDT